MFVASLNYSFFTFEKLICIQYSIHDIDELIVKKRSIIFLMSLNEIVEGEVKVLNVEPNNRNATFCPAI